jgi:uncharacterized protein with gpF-like domain
MAGARSLPFESVKVWISAKDSRTRRIPRDQFDHVEMDGVTVDLEQPFVTQGKQGQQVIAMQPGDLGEEGRKVPAGFTINCRCRVAFQGKRDKDGRLIMKR